MDAQTRARIKARREDILAGAQCECGATLAACEAQRGKDPTAPPWFGCCARTLSFLPCLHVPSTAALLRLLTEIEEGNVQPVPTDEEKLLAGLVEYPMRRRGLSAAVLAMTADSWPDDVPMEF